jgi:hypothetical protein
MRFVWSLLLAFAVVCALAFAPRAAWGQATTTPSVSGILGTVSRCTGSTSSACNDDADNPFDQGGFPHANGVLVNVLNFEDCSADLWYQFQVGISYPSSSYTLQAWVGTQDCSVLTNRQTSATSVCWPVIVPTEALTNPYLLGVRMQDIASGVFTTTHPVAYTPSGASVCQGQVETGASTVTLYIFFADPGSNPVGTVQNYPITFDMRAGNAQGPISVGIGDTALFVSIPQTSDPDTQGWNIYCDPPANEEAGAIQTSVAVDAPSNNGMCPAQVPDSSVADSSLTDGALDGAGDAIAIEDAGAIDSSGVVVKDDAGGSPCGVTLNEASIPSPGGCAASTVLIPGGTTAIAGVDEAGEAIYEEGGTTTTVVDYEGGVAPTGLMNLAFQYGQPTGMAHLCGQTGGTSTSYNIVGLLDGNYYNVAIAATDAAGNVGPLSNVVCQTPQPISDFWTLYTEAGGGAGGGFCSADGVGVPAGTSGLGVLMVASIVTMVRRRRRS